MFQLSQKLSEKGRLITYSRAAAIRGSLKRAGLKLKSLLPEKEEPNKWSAGTIASKQILEKKTSIDANQWKELSPMEEEHLATRAAIPYRDPTGIDQANEILKRRYNEQQNCNLTSTSRWRKRWKQPN